MNGRITIATASKLMNVSPQFIRVGLQQGILPIGSAIKISGAKKKYTYYISPLLFKDYTGIEVKED